MVAKTEVRNGVTTTTGYAYDTIGRLHQVRENGTLTEQYFYHFCDISIGTHDGQDRLRTYGNWAYT